VTARSGRIDSSADKSELVLQDAMQTRLPSPEARDQSFVVERLDLLRIVFNTGRGGLLERMQKEESGPDEMSLTELRQFIAQSKGAAKRDAAIIFHKRLAFSLTPFVFSLFGAALALRMRRGSRGFGVLMSLLVLLVYYLLTLGGDQMGRAGSLPPVVGGWLATALTLALGVALLTLKRRQFGFRFRHSARQKATVPKDDEVSLIATPGHTPGHVSVLIESRGEQAVITGDLMHNPIQIAVPATEARFDMDKPQAARTRCDFVQRFCNSGTLVIGSHFAEPTSGRIVPDGKAWKLEV